MADFIGKLLQILEYVSPLKIVWDWEAGCLYRFGRFRRTLRPGIYWIIPIIWEVKTDTIVPDLVQSPLQTITLADGSTLTYSAQFTLKINNLGLAYNKVAFYSQSAREIASAATAEKFSEFTKKDLLDVAKRVEICDNILVDINNSLAEYGMECTKISIINFVVNMRTLRLIQDDKIV